MSTFTTQSGIEILDPAPTGAVALPYHDNMLALSALRAPVVIRRGAQFLPYHAPDDTDPAAETDVQRGTALLAAFGDLESGDALFLNRAGVYDIGTDVIIPRVDGVTVKGLGMRSSVIKGERFGSGAAGVMFYMGSNCYYQDFGVDNDWAGEAAEATSKAFGLSPTAGDPIVNTVFHRVRGRGSGDALYIVEENTPSTSRSYNCEWWGRWDGVTVQWDGDHVCDGDFMRVEQTLSNQINGAAWIQRGATLTIRNSRLEVDGGSSTGNVIGVSSNLEGSLLIISNSTVEVSGPSGTPFAFRTTFDGTLEIGRDVRYDRALVDGDGVINADQSIGFPETTDDPLDATPANRPPGRVGDCYIFDGDAYVCTNAATPVYKAMT